MHNRLFAVLAMMTLAAVLAGCGGGGNSAVSPAAGGRAAFTITWPPKGRATSRLIPAATQSLSIVLKDGDVTVGSRTVARPESTTTSTVSFTDLPFKALTATATAYPAADAQGTPVASATTSVTVTTGAPATASLTMASTIDHLSVDYGKASLLVAEQTVVGVTAYDASNSVVLLTLGGLNWNSDDTSKVTAVAGSIGAHLTGVGPGLAHVTVTDTESSVSKQFDVLCMQFTLSPESDQTISVRGAQTFASTIAGPEDVAKTWSVVKSDGSVATDGGSVDSAGHYTAPLQPGAESFYYVQAVSHFDPTRARKAKITIVSGSANIGVQ